MESVISEEEFSREFDKRAHWPEWRLMLWACWFGVRRGTVAGFLEAARSRFLWAMIALMNILVAIYEIRKVTR